MKRLSIITWLLVFFCAQGKAQISSFGGELRYDYRYQDYKSGDILTKFVSNTPMLNLRMRGDIVSPRLMMYSFYTSLNANYASTSNSFFNYSGRQLTWNIYNLSMNVLPYSPVRLNIAARENAYAIKSTSDFSTERSGNRQQEQRAEITVQQVPWLPSLSLSYVRNRSFATTGNQYEFVSQTLAFSAAGANDTTGSYNFSSVMSDFRDPLSGEYDRYLTLQFSGSRALSGNQEVNINSEYNKYSGYSTLNGSVGYSGTLTDRLRVMMGLTGSSAISPFSQSRSFGLSQSASYSINQNFSCGMGMSGFIGNAQKLYGRDSYKNWRGSGSLQHHRTVLGFTMTNSASFGYSTQLTTSNYNSLSAGFSNSLSRTIGSFVVNGDYMFSYSRVRSSFAYDVFGNSAGLSLNGMLPYRIQSQSNVRYRNDHYTGNETVYRNSGSLIMTERMNTSFVYIIPFTVGVTGTANFYLAGITGRTYGWTVSIASTSFFLRGLFASYVYSKNYDPYYEREIIEHTGSLSLNWRAISISSRFRYATFPVRMREIQLILTRPF